MKSINPKNNEVINSYDELSDDQINSIINKANSMYRTWSCESFSHRSKLFHNLSDVLLKNSEKYSKLMTDEMGKPISQSKKEIEKCAWVCRYYADNAEKFLETKTIETDHELSEVVYRPLGVILAVMPWNFPFWQVLRFAAPTLMAGNTAVLKHASNVAGCALAIEEAFLEAGFNEGIFNTLLISSKKVESVIENYLIKAVSLTGSTGAGKKVAEVAGKNLKPSLLELGGSDAYIIHEDADIDHAASECVKSRMQNNGQSCIGAKRFIIHESIYDNFKEKFISHMEKYVCSDPLSDDCKLGPIAKVDLKNELHDQVSRSLDLGAKVVIGANPQSDKDAFYPPTIIENIKQNMPAYKEEFFGPVAIFFKVKNLEEALEIANDTSFGLGGGIFTSNIELGKDVARNKMNSGSCFVNSFVSSDPRLPFGGINESGYGRELSSNGITEFVNIKTVCIDKPNN